MSCWANQNSQSWPLFIERRYKACTSREIFQDYYEFLDTLSAENAEDKSNEFRTQDLFAGDFQGKIWRAWVTDDGNKGRQAEQPEAKKVWISAKGKKPFVKAFAYPVEQIYSSLKGREEEVYLGLYWDGFMVGVREFYHWDGKSQWKSVSTDSCKLKDSDLSIRQLIRLYPLPDGKVFCWFYQAGKQIFLVKNNSFESPIIKLAEVSDPNPLFNVSFDTGKNEFSYETKPLGKSKGERKIVLWPNTVKDLKTITAPPNPEDPSRISRYLPVKYFGFDYLFLQYYSGGNMDSLMATTHMQDPMQRHRLDLTGILNSNTGKHSPWSGSAVYSVEPTTWANIGGLVGYNKFIARFSENSNEYNIRESVFAGPTWTKRGNEWMYIAQGLVTKEDQNDLLYSRKIEAISLTQRLVYKDFKIGAFWQLADWELALLEQRSKFNGESYYGYRIRQDWQWRLAENHYISTQIHHARLVTPSGTAKEGAFYGGGIPNFFVGAISFPSYVVAPSGIFGKEITSALLQHQYRFWYKNPANGISSFSLRSLEWFWGLEYLESDWVVLSKSIKKNPEIESWHVGLSFNTSAFYLLPIKFSLAYAKPFNYSQLEGGINLYLGVDVRF
jgi:hypothetical protein